MKKRFELVKWVGLGGLILSSAVIFSGCDGECPFSAPASKTDAVQKNNEKSQNTNGGVWMTDFELAKSQAKISNKPILLSFSGSDWCSWCMKLDNEVFSKPEFQKWSKENVITVSVDFPRRHPQSMEQKQQNEALAVQYGVDSFPTVILVDADGNVLGKTGYRSGGAEAYTAYLGNLLKR